MKKRDKKPKKSKKWARFVEDVSQQEFRVDIKPRAEREWRFAGAPLTTANLMAAYEMLKFKEDPVPVNPNERPVPITTLPELKKACEDLKEFSDTATFSVTEQELVMLKRCAIFMEAAYQHELYLRASEKPSPLKMLEKEDEARIREREVAARYSGYADNLDVDPPDAGPPVYPEFKPAKHVTEVSTFAGRSLEPTPAEARAWMEWRNKFYPGGLPQDNDWWSRLEGIMRGKAGRNVDSTKPDD